MIFQAVRAHIDAPWRGELATFATISAILVSCRNSQAKTSVVCRGGRRFAAAKASVQKKLS